MGITIKVPVKDVKGKKDVRKVVEETLREDKNNAYTIMGLMIAKFDVKESDINGKPFSQWKEGHPSLYTKIRIALEKLKKEGRINSTKSGRAYVYWWNENLVIK